MWEIWAKSCPKYNKSPELVTLLLLLDVPFDKSNQNLERNDLANKAAFETV